MNELPISRMEEEYAQLMERLHGWSGSPNRDIYAKSHPVACRHLAAPQMQ